MDYFLIYLGIGVAVTAVHLWQKRIFRGGYDSDIAATLILLPLLWPLPFFARHWDTFRPDPPYIRQPFIPPIGWLRDRLTREEEAEMRIRGVHDAHGKTVMLQLTPDCELWHFFSPTNTWQHMCGLMGVCVVKDGAVVDGVIMGGN
jgi:hypothetical protein